MFILKIDTAARAARRRVSCQKQINSCTDCATHSGCFQICSYKWLGGPVSVAYVLHIRSSRTKTRINRIFDTRPHTLTILDQSLSILVAQSGLVALDFEAQKTAKIKLFCTIELIYGAYRIYCPCSQD
jgi:hypothetical protein